jgi:GH15 family glucan-1,4-alpha-glucosidase
MERARLEVTMASDTSSSSTVGSAEREASAALPSPFPPIAEYAFLSNCHTGSLVAPDGSVDWLCVPRFDSPSVFGSLLDREAGSFRIGPFGINVPSARSYEPGTNVLETTWKTPRGWVVVRDALTMGPSEGTDAVTPHTRPPADDDAEHLLVRVAECVGGRVEVEVVCEPVFDYGRTPATWQIVDGEGHVAEATGADVTLRLHTDLRVGVEGGRVRGRHVLEAGERIYCALSWADPDSGPADGADAERRIDATVSYWRRWLDGARIPDHRYREPIQRSALAVKGLTYMPTGATVAALTTGLPETPGGERNWDYRYSWMRDSTFTLQALHWLNLDWEADEFMQFVADLEANDDGGMQIMYGIDGRRDLTETTLDHLSGYAGARPVRIGNGAYDQRQNDVFGAVLDSIYLHSRRSQRLPRRLWPIVQAQATCATNVWQQPDQGIWEARGQPQHYVSSKLMCWVALDRAAKLAGMRGDGALHEQWQATADEIHADVLEHGVSKKGVLRQHYETDSLDASTLLAPIFGFLPGDDERAHASVLAVADELSENGFVLRYRTDETDDGLSGKEGTFLICSYWLVSGLSIVGEHQRARDLFEKLMRIASPLGLYAEEFDVDTGFHLGNFPQAFSHLALIEAAGRIIISEYLPEF